LDQTQIPLYKVCKLVLGFNLKTDLLLILRGNRDKMSQWLFFQYLKKKKNFDGAGVSVLGFLASWELPLKEA